MDNGIANLLGGLANGLNGYLGKQQDAQLMGQKYQMLQKAMEGRQEDVAAFKGGVTENVNAAKNALDTPIDADTAEKEFPGQGGDFVKGLMASNGGQPVKMKDVMGALANKTKITATGNTKHYLGNDPEGNAIFGDNQGNLTSPDGSKYSGKVLPKSSNMPTSSTRSSAEFATTILPHIDEMRGLIQQADAKGFIGPAAGRVYNQFMAGTVGSTGSDEADNLLGKIRSMDSLLKTGAMRVHFGARGGANMYDHFSDMLNTGKQSAAMLNGSLDTMQDFMQGYANAGTPGGVSKAGSKPTSAPVSGNPKDPFGIL